MKRAFAAVLAVILVVPALLCGACAAESYIFELMPNIEYYDGITVPSDGSAFIYDGDVPSVEYWIWADLKIDGVIVPCCSDSPIRLSFSDQIHFSDVSFSFSVDDTVFSYPCRIGAFAISGISCITIENLSDGRQMAEFLSYIELVPVDSSGPVVSAFDFQPLVDGVTGQISVSTVVGVIVGIIGTCAGLTFGWWGVRKTTSLLMAAFRKGKLHL